MRVKLLPHLLRHQLRERLFVFVADVRRWQIVCLLRGFCKQREEGGAACMPTSRHAGCLYCTVLCCERVFAVCRKRKRCGADASVVGGNFDAVL